MRKIADSTVRRLSLYLRFLEAFAEQGIGTISSDELAHRGGTTSAQVRKDLSLFGSFGKRGLGYSVPELDERLRGILGLERTYSVAVVGAGKIGSALAQHTEFGHRGFPVRRVYDSDPRKIGRSWNGLKVRDARKIGEDFTQHPVDIVILAVPAEGAQQVVDRVVQLGVKAILNFAPVQLAVPDDVTVKNVSMAMELEALSYALRNR